MGTSDRKQAKTGIEDARQYAENHRKYTRLMFGGLLKKINALGKSGRFLEAGAGPGFLTAMIAETNPHVNITALDLSPDMAAVAGEYISERKLEGRISYVVGDVADEELMKGLGEYDLVYSSYSLHEWQEPEKSIRNLWRAVRDNGLMYIYDFRKMAWLRFLPFKSGEKDAIMATPSARKMQVILKATGITEYSVRTRFPFLHQTILATK